MKRARGLELFIRDGVNDDDRFPHSVAVPDNQPATGSLVNSQSFAREPEILRYGLLILPNSPQRINFDPIHLLDPSGLRRAVETTADEQQLFCSYEYAAQLFVNVRPKTLESVPQLPTVTWEHRAVIRQSETKVQRTRQADVRKRVPRKPQLKTGRKTRRSN